MRLLFSALLLLAFETTTWAQQDPFGIPDTIRIGNAQVYPGSAFAIPIYLFNDEQLMGLTIPLVLRGEAGDVRCDSVVFDPGRTGLCQYRNARIDGTTKSVLIGIVPSLDSVQLYIEPGSGEIARAYFSYTGSPQGGVDTLGACELPPYNDLRCVGMGITPFVPEFEHGLIELEPMGAIESGAKIPQWVNIYPNPSNSSVNFEIYLQKGDRIGIKIFSILGQLVHEDFIAGSVGLNLVRFDIPTEWSSGIYLLRISGNGEYSTIRFILLR